MRIVIDSKGEGNLEITAGKKDERRDIEFVALALVTLWKKMGGNQGSFRKFWKLAEKYNKQIDENVE